MKEGRPRHSRKEKDEINVQEKYKHEGKCTTDMEMVGAREENHTLGDST